MAYKIKLGSFSKLENSTAQPSITNWAEYDVTLKEGADISNPTLTLNISWTTVAAYNYAYFMNRYYFITGKNMLRENLCVIDLKVDTLATYKSTIGATSMYILRSSTQVDYSIRDNYYPAVASVARSHQVQTTGIPGDFSTGVYVLNVSGTKTAAGTTLYQFTPANFKTLLNNLYTTLNGFQLSDVVGEVVKRFGGNPQSLVNGAMWFPFPFDVASVQEDIHIGNWASGVQGGIITDPVMTLADYSYTIFLHPQATVQRSYLNMAPFRQFTIGLPGCGVVQLDSSKLIDETSITVRRIMDAFSGQLITKVIANTSEQILAYLSGRIGVPISLYGSSDLSSVTGAVGTIASLGAGLVTGGAGSIVGALTGGIGTVLDAFSGSPASTNIGSGAAAIMTEAGWLDQTDIYVEDGDNARNGRPYMQVTTPATIGGFMMADKGVVKISAPLPEQQEVNNYMTSGFYYE